MCYLEKNLGRSFYSAWFIVDERSLRFDRNVITIFDVIADLGGLLEFVYILLMVVLTGYQKFEADSLIIS